MSSRYMSLENALATIQERGVFLHYDAERGVDLWTPHTKMPISVRRAVVKYNQELQAMMARGDARVCPSPKLHKKYSRCAVTCSVCQRLDIA